MSHTRKWLKHAAFLTALAALSALLPAPFAAARQAMEAGFRVETFTDPARQRPVMIDWWYPVAGQEAETLNYGLGEGRVVVEGKVAAGTFPLVLLSHGASGAARNYSWLAQALARKGFVVAGVSHFQESYVYGEDTMNSSAVLRWWLRPPDISAVITHVSAGSSLLSTSVAERQIAFVGHSSGGATALFLAGLSFAGERLAAYCGSELSVHDRGCDYSDQEEADREGADQEEADQEGAGQEALSPLDGPPGLDYGDPRIRAFVALDPALGPGFAGIADQDVSAAPSGNVLLVGSVNNDFLPFQHHAQRIAELLSGARRLWLDEGEGHFVYLNECDLDTAANGVPLCTDRPEVSRAATHERLITQISEFLNGALDYSRL